MDLCARISATPAINNKEDDETKSRMLVPELALAGDGATHQGGETTGGSRTTTKVTQAGRECGGEEALVGQLFVKK